MTGVLILGAKGYLGQHLEKRLKKDSNNKIISIDKKDVDLRNERECDYLFENLKFDEIFQLAADSGNMEYILSDNFSYGDSTVININIIKALKNHNYNGKILFPSTFYIYDGSNSYGVEKRYNEQLYLHSGLNVKIPRLFSVYGPGELINSPREKVITAFCRKYIEATDTLEIIGSPTQSRYFLHVADAIEGLIAMMSFDTTCVMDLSGNEKITFEKILHTIETIDGRHIDIKYSLENKNEKVIFPDLGFAETVLNWKPKISFKKGMEELYKWVAKELENESC